MELTELIAENIVNKLSGLLKKKISVGDMRGDVLASTELSETGKNYDQLRSAAESGDEVEVTRAHAQPGGHGLEQGLIVPITYNNEVVGTVFIQDKIEEYRHYRQLVPVTVDLLVHQNLVIDNFPYKDKIKDNFVYGMLHRQAVVEDPKVREEAELFDINLNRDKITVIVSPEGFWQSQFDDNPTAGEDEKQELLSAYKKRIFKTMSDFFGRLSGCTVSYFGSDVFVAMVDELYSMEGEEMVNLIRQKSWDFHKMMSAQFPGMNVRIAVGSFYKGKDGAILAYEEGRRALNLALTMAYARPVFHIDDLGMTAALVGGNRKWQESFVRRVLAKLNVEDYLSETVTAFFIRNMSLTQTAKDLKIHRNTLLYRLDKVKKISGLDPRNFNEAMQLQVALILNKIMQMEKSLSIPAMAAPPVPARV